MKTTTKVSKDGKVTDIYKDSSGTIEVARKKFKVGDKVKIKAGLATSLLDDEWVKIVAVKSNYCELKDSTGLVDTINFKNIIDHKPKRGRPVGTKKEVKPKVQQVPGGAGVKEVLENAQQVREWKEQPTEWPNIYTFYAIVAGVAIILGVGYGEHLSRVAGALN